MLWQSSSFPPPPPSSLTLSLPVRNCTGNTFPTVLQKLTALLVDDDELQSGHVWWLRCSSVKRSIPRCCQSNWFSFRVVKVVYFRAALPFFHSCYCWKTARAAFTYSQPGWQWCFLRLMSQTIMINAEVPESVGGAWSHSRDKRICHLHRAIKLLISN